jgi:hypothetical protein
VNPALAAGGQERSREPRLSQRLSTGKRYSAAGLLKEDQIAFEVRQQVA